MTLHLVLIRALGIQIPLQHLIAAVYPQLSLLHRSENLNVKGRTGRIGRHLLPHQPEHDLQDPMAVVPFQAEKIPAVIIQFNFLPIIDPVGV